MNNPEDVFNQIIKSVMGILYEDFIAIPSKHVLPEGMYIFELISDCVDAIEVLVWNNFTQFKVSYGSHDERDEVEIGDIQELITGIISSVRNLTEEFSSNVSFMERRNANTGSFAHLPEPMQLRHVKRIANKYKIDLTNIKVTIQCDPDSLRVGYTGIAAKNRIDLLPNAFISEEELARTLYHEQIHVEQYRDYGVEYVQNNKQWFETQAEKLEDERFGERSVENV